MSQPFPDQNKAFALIIDTSASAASGLEEARQTAQKIKYLIGSEQFQIFALGSPTPIPSATLRQAGPPDAGQESKVCSLIAPIMEVLVRQEQKQSVIIVGNGEIYDLDDWADDLRVDGWLLVKTGEQSLKGPASRLTEIRSDQVTNDEDTLFSHFSRFTPEPCAPAPRPPRHGRTYEWRVDGSGYPLILVEPFGLFVHLFPVTRPQFEKFITNGRQPSDMGDGWYDIINALNPRASYRSPDIPARERLFMTGVTTDEANRFSRWLGRDYTLLSAEEWCACCEWFAHQPAMPVPEELAGRLSSDARAVWEIVESQWLEERRPASLQELSLMTQGILEWVVERPGRYCGLGDPATSKFQRKAYDPVRPLGPEPRRLKNLGFRLRAR